MKEVNYLLWLFNENVKKNEPGLISQSIEVYRKSQLVVEEGCVKTTVTNCKIFKDFNNCSECNTGYYEEKGKCIAYPKEAIPNCDIYLKEKEC